LLPIVADNEQERLPEASETVHLLNGGSKGEKCHEFVDNEQENDV